MGAEAQEANPLLINGNQGRECRGLGWDMKAVIHTRKHTHINTHKSGRVVSCTVCITWLGGERTRTGQVDCGVEEWLEVDYGI